MTRIVNDTLRRARDEDIRAALASSDPMVLRGLIYHATGNDELASVPIANVPAGFASANVVADEAGVERIRQLAFDLIAAYRDGRSAPPETVSPERLLRAMDMAAGEPVPREELGLHTDILSFDEIPKGWGEEPRNGMPEDFNVVVIGSGLAGINAAVQLKASGIDFTVLEKNGGVGGTWYNNRYPGARVDWPSRLYSHSFGVDYPFRHPFAPRAENEAYMRWCVDTYGLAPHMEFGCEVTELVWQDEDGVWSIRSRDGEGRERVRTARALISAIGLLERPSMPDIPGMDRFKGPIFHSSRFDPTVDLSGKRVAQIGTGASGMQMTPDLAPLVEHLTVFQRSPGWVLPAPGYRDELPDGVKWLDANVPYYTNWTRFTLGWMLGDYKLFKVFEVDEDWPDMPRSVNAENQAARERCLAHLRAQLADRPDLIAKCTPDYPVFGNRPVIDNGWFGALLRGNVSLVTDRVERFTETGIVTADGTEHPADIAVMATGFRPNEYFSPMRVIGRSGRTIEELWDKDGPRAYWGVAVPHLPNFFILYGPNANPRNLGPVQYGEWAIDYILHWFRTMIEQGWRSIEVSREAYDTFNAELDERCRILVSVHPKTNHKSYYTTDFGRSAVQSPWSSAEVWRAFRNPRDDDYHIEPATTEPMRRTG